MLTSIRILVHSRELSSWLLLLLTGYRRGRQQRSWLEVVEDAKYAVEAGERKVIRLSDKDMLSLIMSSSSEVEVIDAL